MKIVVPVKRVIDANVKIRVDETQGVETNNVKMSLNPFCEIAVEEAVRLKEAGIASEIIVVTVGAKVSKEQLLSGLALGADRAILVESSADIQPLTIAKVLCKIYDKEQPDIVLFGKQSIDGDNSQTGSMFAALKDLPQATFASKVSVDKDNKTVEVTREVDGGLQTLSLNLPAVITTDLRLNEPRYAKLPNIMKAKKKPMDIIALDSLEIDEREHYRVVSVTQPPQRPPGIKVASVEELVDKLKNEAKVI